MSSNGFNGKLIVWISEKLLIGKTIVKFFDTKKEVPLSTDASERVFSPILSQDGRLRLTTVEINYSNTENVALAIVWGIDSVWILLLVKTFLLKSDHKFLEFIFNTRKKLPKLTSSRILRLIIKSMSYDFDIEYVK